MELMNASMTDLIFRHARIQDLQRIVDIYNSTINSRMVTADTEPVSIQSRRNWFHAHSQDKRPLWVIENDNGHIIAWMSLQSFYGRPAYHATAEISIYIDQEERGRGLGRQLLQYCIEQAPSLGIKTIIGFVFAHNQPSLNLFEKIGFKSWAFLPGVAELDGRERDLIILGKRVG